MPSAILEGHCDGLAVVLDVGAQFLVPEQDGAATLARERSIQEMRRLRSPSTWSIATATARHGARHGAGRRRVLETAAEIPRR